MERFVNGRFQKLTLRPDDLQIVPRGREIGERSKPWRECLALGISDALIGRTTLEVFNKDRVDLLPSDGVRDPQILYISQALWSEAQAGYPCGRLYGESLALGLVMRLLSGYSASPVRLAEAKGGMPRRLLRQAVDYIDANLTTEIRLDDLAENLNISPYHLCRQFKQSMGMAPHQYVIRQRIGRAKRMLVESRQTIAEISNELGFFDQSHFCSVFRKITGTTPKRFRDGA